MIVEGMVNIQPIMNQWSSIEGGRVRQYLSSCSAVYLQNDCNPSTSQLTVWKTNNMADAPVTINIYDPASAYMSHHQCMWSTIAFFSILNGLKHDYKLGPAQDSVELQGVGSGGWIWTAASGIRSDVPTLCSFFCIHMTYEVSNTWCCSCTEGWSTLKMGGVPQGRKHRPPSSTLWWGACKLHWWCFYIYCNALLTEVLTMKDNNHCFDSVLSGGLKNSSRTSSWSKMLQLIYREVRWLHWPLFIGCQ